MKLSQALKDSLKELITIAGDQVQEIEVEKRLFGWKLRVSKGGSVAQSIQVAAPAAPATALASNSSDEIPAAESVSGTLVLSPMVGTFYTSPSPDADAFLSVGDVVSAGQTVCIIEAMKIMNEIEAEVSGRVTQVLVENGSPVEYNTPLFMVDPS